MTSRSHIPARLLSWELKTTVIYRNKDDITRNEDDCYLQLLLMKWRRLLYQGRKTILISRDDDCYVCQRMKTTVIYSNEYDCNHQGWRWLMSQNEDNPYLEKWRRLLSPGMKTTVISRNGDNSISRNEDHWYLKEWRRLLSPGMKTTIISRNEDNCYLKEWRQLEFQEFQGLRQLFSLIILRNEDHCYL